MQLRIRTLLLAGLMCAAPQFAKAECGEGSCSIQSAFKTLPRLEYQVGATTTACAKSAAKLSQKEGLPIKFVIKQAFENEAAATLALAEKTEALVKQFATSTECKISGRISVGGKSLSCSEKASVRAKLIGEAIDAVKVSYKVGDKVSNCPIESKKLAAESKVSVVFVVDGKETACPIRHRLNAARAKYRAAVEAVAKLDREGATN